MGRYSKAILSIQVRKNIRKYRLIRGYTLQELADLTELTHGYVRDLECLSIDKTPTLETIGKFAFMCSSALEEVTIPNSVKNIETSAFSGPSSSITSVYYSGTEEGWSEINIDSGNDNLKNANIIYNN